jgi:hypothetical protein
MLALSRPTVFTHGLPWQRDNSAGALIGKYVKCSNNTAMSNNTRRVTVELYVSTVLISVETNDRCLTSALISPENGLAKFTAQNGGVGNGGDCFTFKARNVTTRNHQVMLNRTD